MDNPNYLLFKAYAKYGELGPKYKKAYDEYVAKMNHLADEMLAAELELRTKLLQLQDEDKSDE